MRSSQTKLAAFNAESEAGKAYLQDAAWAVEYAAANRLRMLDAVRAIMLEAFGVRVIEESLIHCQHNHVRRERHFGESLWVHRKGALPAEEGALGVIPGSMGTRSYHVRGRGEADALRSSSHGAGRVKSRAAAGKEISAREFMRQMRGVWFDQRRTSQLRDEAPSAS